ncbi:hypothetical protein CEXT_799671 [Caerostris extrusa]|uniref:Uncharacterized protein n=1 Tax=Caerostris extrusa TaxID=172846 RepID=A0AAV4M3F5_CAEEX|nr:hypothetical protein CEXT_799671 [Caerostris extrusa]
MRAIPGMVIPNKPFPPNLSLQEFAFLLFIAFYPDRSRCVWLRSGDLCSGIDGSGSLVLVTRDKFRPWRFCLVAERGCLPATVVYGMSSAGNETVLESDGFLPFYCHHSVAYIR